MITLGHSGWITMPYALKYGTDFWLYKNGKLVAKLRMKKRKEIEYKSSEMHP